MTAAKMMKVTDAENRNVMLLLYGGVGEFHQEIEELYESLTQNPKLNKQHISETSNEDLEALLNSEVKLESPEMEEEDDSNSITNDDCDSS